MHIKCFKKKCLKPSKKELILSHKLWFSNSHIFASLKYSKVYIISCFKDIEIRNFEFVTKTPLLFTVSQILFEPF